MARRKSYDFLNSYGNLQDVLAKYAGMPVTAGWMIKDTLPEDGKIATLADSYVDVDTSNKLLLCHAEKVRADRGMPTTDISTVQLIFFMDHLTSDIKKSCEKKEETIAGESENAEVTLPVNSTFLALAQVLDKKKSVVIVDGNDTYMGVLTRKGFIQGISHGASTENRLDEALTVGAVVLTKTKES